MEVERLTPRGVASFTVAGGTPIHFAVTYGGYLLALWAWRHRRVAAATRAANSAAVGIRSFGLAIVVAGGAASLILGELPGFTWFLVRLLITVTFLLVWWGLFGFELLANIVGGVVLAFIWATYADFLLDPLDDAPTLG
jgi:hypothetical protein